MILEPAFLTLSGRPVLQPGEVEKYLLDNVDLEFEGSGGLPGLQAEAYKGGYVILTNMRLIWIDAAATSSMPSSAAAAPAAGQGGAVSGRQVGRCCSLPASSVQSAAKKSSFAFTGSKVRVHLEVYATHEGKPVPGAQVSHKLERVALRCRGDSPETLIAKLEEVRRAAAAAPPTSAAAPASTWQQQQPQQQQGAVPAPVPGAAAEQQRTNHVDPKLLQQMIDMGFPRNRAARCLIATKNEGVQQAMDYLLAFGEQPGMDDPLDTSGSGAAPAAAAHPAYPPQPYYAAAQPSGAYPAYPPYPYAPGPLHSGLQPGYPPAPYQPQPAYPGGVQPGAAMHNPLLPGLQAQQQQLTAAGLATGAGAGTYSGLMQHAGQWGAAGGVQYPTPVGQGVQQWPPPVPAAPPPGQQVTPVAPGFAGVSGLVRREQEKSSATTKSLDTAFQDLQALMTVAADMVQLAERFRGVMAQSGGNEDELMDAETQLELIAMGIASPVTKESAGARYHMELSRQLSDFLEEPLRKAGGMMTVADVYCLYNRARGTELVSPDDLLQAFKMFDQLKLPVKLRTLPSGLTVVQSAAHTDEQVCSRIEQLLVEQMRQQGEEGAVTAGVVPLGPAITATDLAKALSITVTIAVEHLLTAELRGVLCRDDGPEGLRFYRNFFPKVQWTA
mmetsp:Transcript_37776/g.84245  ORF Transcript_37776/g.84245 Transcript_37776/m.84245 type:complete len:668 (-) Transcript_37776:143-2146(-)|eukprot:CAMPEP_0202894570 /NCGR_PEP_ID=MMETSP1392-20130828/3948_1 /ASSEMBLY_ACC=CAM_ASM_000868 /TAXON_ID=225041 /ORGANISM="Chlamydomonas chlamydogama, Strain SAG 11-48b" /LENGTH=667 /DNA_ID=CAMNT_0049579307 /DNA_START=12 /DNA_END=2015 /DNA_ORIENTATION=+